MILVFPLIRKLKENHVFSSPAVPLSDPTWFAPVINYVKSIAEHMKNDPNNYLVLLIITDGGIEGT